MHHVAWSCWGPTGRHPLREGAWFSPLGVEGARRVTGGLPGRRQGATLGVPPPPCPTSLHPRGHRLCPPCLDPGDAARKEHRS